MKLEATTNTRNVFEKLIIITPHCETVPLFEN